MGWTSEHRDKGTSNKDWFAMQLDHAGGKVLDAATVGNTCYIAYQVTDDDGSQYTTAIVALTQWRPHDAYNFSAKVIDESMGPGEHRCPERILNQLSPLNEIPFSGKSLEWATAWRVACRARLVQKKMRGSVSSGDHVLFKNSIRFSDGHEAERFEWIRGNGFYRLQRVSGNWQREARVGIRSWRELDWAKAA